MAAAINIAAANLGGSGSAATVTFSAVPGYIVASFSSRSGGSTPTLNAPTVNGNAMTALGTEYSNGAGNRMRLYGYTQSATESVTVVGSLDANFYLKGLEVTLWTGATASPVSNIGGVNSSGANVNATVSSATGDLVCFHIEDVDSRTLTPGTGSTSVTGTGLNSTYQWILTEAGAASVTIGGSYPGTTDAWGIAYSVASAVVAPVLTGPSGAATGPTQATIGVTSDTTGSISSLILPAATAAPADAATLIADGAAVVRTVAAAGAPQTFAVTGLTTNTAVRVHWAMAGSNVVSSAAFTPNTLAIGGTALSAQTGTAGAAFVWAGATPESLITNAGNGSGSWTAIAGVGASGATVNSSTGILVAGSLGTAGNYTITLQRADGSTVPGAQTVTKTVGLTIGASGDVTAPTMSAASVTGGVLSATGSITSNETGALWTKMDGNATAADPGAGNEAGAGWTSQSMLAASNAVSFGVQPAGLRYGHFLGVDAAGNRAAVVNASGTVTGVATYGFSCGPFALNPGTGPVLNVPVSYTLNLGEVGAASGSPINGTGTIHASTGLLAVSGLAAAGLYSVQIKNADGSSRWHGTATAA